MAPWRWRGTSAPAAAFILVHNSERRHGRKETFTSQAHFCRRQDRRKQHDRAEEILGHAATHARRLSAVVEKASPVEDDGTPPRRPAEQTDRYPPPQAHEARRLSGRLSASMPMATACDHQKIRRLVSRERTCGSGILPAQYDPTRAAPIIAARLEYGKRLDRMRVLGAGYRHKRNFRFGHPFPPKLAATVVRR